MEYYFVFIVDEAEEYVIKEVHENSGVTKEMSLKQSM